MTYNVFSGTLNPTHFTSLMQPVFELSEGLGPGRTPSTPGGVRSIEIGCMSAGLFVCLFAGNWHISKTACPKTNMLCYVDCETTFELFEFDLIARAAPVFGTALDCRRNKSSNY